MVELVESKTDLQTREGILRFEDALMSHEHALTDKDTESLVSHYFSDGIYTRRIFLPAGMALTGKLHKHDHPNVMLRGKVLVATESGGEEVIEAPMFCISPSMTKRALYVLEDTVWITFHHNPTNTRDLGELEELIIQSDMTEYRNELKQLEVAKEVSS